MQECLDFVMTCYISWYVPCLVCLFFCFFFSSRRRHTRFDCDWSSDVCSSDLCYIGIKQSAAFNSVIVAIKVTVVVLFILFGVSYIDAANWHPFIPPNTGKTGQFGWSGIMGASGVIFFAYIGFDAISTAAQETKNPQRDMPIGILASLVICTVLYVLVAAVLTGMVSYKELDVAAPVALALDKYPGLHWLGIPLKLGAVAGMTSVMLVMTIAQARIFFAMARDGLLPPFFGRVHPRFRTPSTGTVITGVSAAVIGGVVSGGGPGRRGALA